MKNYLKRSILKLVSNSPGLLGTKDIVEKYGDDGERILLELLTDHHLYLNRKKKLFITE